MQHYALCAIALTTPHARFPALRETRPKLPVGRSQLPQHAEDNDDCSSVRHGKLRHPRAGGGFPRLFALYAR